MQLLWRGNLNYKYSRSEENKHYTFVMWCWRRIPWLSSRTNVSLLSKIDVQRWLFSEMIAHMLCYFEQVICAGRLASLAVWEKVSRGRTPACSLDVLRKETQSTFVECARAAQGRKRLWRMIETTVSIRHPRWPYSRPTTCDNENYLMWNTL